MNTCEYKEYIIEYLDGSTDANPPADLQAHIDGCKVCQAALKDLAPIHQALKAYRRPKPSRAFRLAYHRELAELYKPSLSLRQRLAAIWRNWVWNPSPAIRMAEIVVIFLSGLWVGRFWTETGTGHKSSTTGTSVEEQLIVNYLSSVEMLLLDVANMETPADFQLIVNSVNCDRMLQKTELLKEEINPAADPILANVLEELELILLELANCDGELEQSEIEFIQQVIRDSHMMVELKNIHTI